MMRFQSLVSRAAWFFVLLLVGLSALSGVFLVKLDNVRTYAARVGEEAREQAEAMEVLTQLNALEALVSSGQPLDGQDRISARRRLQTALDQVHRLEGHEGDPSHEDHSHIEHELQEALQEDLLQLLELTGKPLDEQGSQTLQTLLESASNRTRELRKEANAEVAQALNELDAQAASMRLAMLAMLLSVLAFVGMALHLVHKRIVRPLVALRRGAERFGLGELNYRIGTQGEDEIGEFARTLNTMADRLADAHEHLEERVRERTGEFLRAARMAHLGVLASGIAHEINTPLATIRSCAEGMDRRLKNGDYTKELLVEYSETICMEVERASGITRRMLALAREEPSSAAVTSLALVIEQVESALAHRASKADVRIVSLLPSEDVELRLNGGELVQIVVNLVANAIDASARGGEVTITTAVDSQNLILTVEDNGEGITPEQLEQVFEPFYTTKLAHEGTGLGLALVSKLVESHRGRVSVQSTPGVGSSFRITLPLDWRRA